jgi:hypothetical protein
MVGSVKSLAEYKIAAEGLLEQNQGLKEENLKLRGQLKSLFELYNQQKSLLERTRGQDQKANSQRFGVQDQIAELERGKKRLADELESELQRRQQLAAEHRVLHTL